MNNVTSVLRRSRSLPDRDNSDMAAKIEFIDITESALREGKPLNIAELEEIYTNILHENEVPSPSCSRKMLKQLVLSEIPDVEFHRPKRMNEHELLTVKETRDESILKSSEDAFFKEDEMKTIYHAALTLRKCINKSDKWLFRRCFDVVALDHPAKDIITSIGTDQALAFDVDAARVLCGVKTVVSMPAADKPILTQRDMVSLETALCGF